MGFYTKGTFLNVPNKRIVDDLLDRQGPPDDNSFSPFNGMSYLIDSQMVGGRYGNVSIDILKASIEDVDMKRLKAKSTYSEEVKGDDEATEEIEYILENIDERYVRDYISQALAHQKKYTSDVRTAVNAMENIHPIMYDVEDHTIFNPSDEFSSDEFEEGLSEIANVRDRIPYLLKKLQDGSIKYGISLLSLFIARDKIIHHKGGKDVKITPKDLLEQPIYNVSGNGDILDTLDTTANNGEKFKIPKLIVLGAFPNDPYYKAGISLTVTARKLGYNLYEEDARDYSPALVNRLLCSYIISNQEVISDIASGDPKILEVLSNGGLFKEPIVKVDSNIDSKISNLINLKSMAISKMKLVPTFHRILYDDRMSRRENKLYDRFIGNPVSSINEFFRLYHKVRPNSSILERDTVDCFLYDEVLCDSSGQPILFIGDGFVFGFSDTPNMNNIYFMITKDGYAVKVDNDMDKVHFTDVVSMVVFMTTGSNIGFSSKVLHI